MFVMPKVGDKVTVQYWSEEQPAQIVKVSKSGKMIWIRDNVTTPATTERECNTWNIHEGQFEGKEYKATFRGDGCFRVTGCNCHVWLNRWNKDRDYGI